MFAKIFIILFFILPQSLSFAAIPKSEDLKGHLSSHPNDSVALYNLALIEQRDGNLALSLALAERSKYLDPLNFGSGKLKTLASEKLRNSSNEQIEGIPMIYLIMDFIPYIILLVLCLSLLILFACALGKMAHTEKISFKSKPKMRMHAAMLGSVLILSIFLLLFKAHSQKEIWACVTSKEARLFTGPNSSNFPQVSTLGAGNCSRVVLIKGSWISLDPSRRAAGWTEKNQVFIVRGNKFDPLFKSD